MRGKALTFQNRLLQMIRQQQHQLQQLQQASGQAPGTTAVVDDSTPTSERSLSFPTTIQNPAIIAHPRPHSPPSFTSRGSIDLSRQSSRRSRRSSREQSSPAIRATSIPPSEQDGSWTLGSSRDESAFYQAETQTLTRENQMLKLRIRELGES